jgi:hypothetical protein
MNMISEIRRRVSADGAATITVDEYNQLQREWITRTGAEDMVAAERERCAQVCDLHSRLTWNDDRKTQSRVLAEEIRRWPNTDPL